MAAHANAPVFIVLITPWRPDPAAIFVTSRPLLLTHLIPPAREGGMKEPQAHSLLEQAGRWVQHPALRHLFKDAFMVLHMAPHRASTGCRPAGRQEVVRSILHWLGTQPCPPWGCTWLWHAAGPARQLLESCQSASSFMHGGHCSWYKRPNTVAVVRSMTLGYLDDSQDPVQVVASIFW